MKLVKEGLKQAVLRCLSGLLRLPGMRGRVRISELVYRLLRPEATTVRMKVGALPVELNLSQPQARHIYFGAYERNEIRFIRSWLNEGDVVVDVGANVGYLSAVMASALGARGKVYAIEPDPGSYSKLKLLEESSRGVIQTSWLAATDDAEDKTEEGERYVTFYANPDHPMWSSTIQVACDARVEPIRVPAATLDEFLTRRQIERVDFIKIDVEGGEARVLAGMQHYLNAGGRPTILCELAPWIHTTFGMSAVEVADLVTRHGFRIFRLARGGRLVEVSRDWLGRRMGTMNCLFIPEERVPEALRAGDGLQGAIARQRLSEAGKWGVTSSR